MSLETEPGTPLLTASCSGRSGDCPLPVGQGILCFDVKTPLLNGVPGRRFVLASISSARYGTLESWAERKPGEGEGWDGENMRLGRNAPSRYLSSFRLIFVARGLGMFVVG